LLFLEPSGEDLRLSRAIGEPNVAFVIGDHLGLDEETRASLAARGAIPMRVGPVAIHADDVVTLISNELDRRQQGAS